jgi:uncharacterized protein (TIGR02597 family)
MFLAASALALTSVNAQTTVTSDVVGYITLNVKGTGGNGSEAISVLGAPLEKAVESTGSLTAVAGNTLTDASATFTSSSFSGTHYLKINSGVNAGITATISSNDETSITTVEDISSLLSGTESYEIRAYTTLSDIFGSSNQSSIGSGASAGVADEILIYNGSGFDIYFYQEGASFGGTGWRSSTNAFSDTSSTIIPYGSAVIVKRKQSADVNVTFAGSVFNSDTFVPVEVGVNWLAGANPVDLTLSSYFGADGGDLLKGASASTADEILVPNSSGGFDVYYYQEGASFGGTGFRSSVNAFSDSASTVIANVGGGFVLKRKGSAFNLADATPLN